MIKVYFIFWRLDDDVDDDVDDVCLFVCLFDIQVFRSKEEEVMSREEKVSVKSRERDEGIERGEKRVYCNVGAGDGGGAGGGRP